MFDEVCHVLVILVMLVTRQGLVICIITSLLSSIISRCVGGATLEEQRHVVSTELVQHHLNTSSTTVSPRVTLPSYTQLVM